MDMIVYVAAAAGVIAKGLVYLSVVTVGALWVAALGSVLWSRSRL